MNRRLPIACPRCGRPWQSGALRIDHGRQCESRAQARPSRMSPAWPMIVHMVATRDGLLGGSR